MSDDRPDPLRPVGLFVPETEDRQWIGEHIVGTLDDIARLIIAADHLGLGWSAQGYYCQTTDEDPGDEVREYRVTIWRSLMSDTLPMLSAEDES